eukprot:COSAG06_NODE_25983_length_624_cov_1.567619_1_plen_44_part_00
MVTVRDTGVASLAFGSFGTGTWVVTVLLLRKDPTRRATMLAED